MARASCPEDGEMLKRVPKNPPEFREILANIGNPPAAEVAKALGVSCKTVQRWRKGNAPKVARLALWSLTSWARDEADKMSAHLECSLRGMVAAYEAENKALRARLARLGQVADFGSANDPSPFVACVKPNANPPTRSSHAKPASGHVMPGAFVSAGHLAKVPALPSTTPTHPQPTPPLRYEGG